MAENAKIETVHVLDADVPTCAFCCRYITEITDDTATDDGHWLVGTGKFIESDKIYCCHQCLPKCYGTAAS